MNTFKIDEIYYVCVHTGICSIIQIGSMDYIHCYTLNKHYD